MVKALLVIAGLVNLLFGLFHIYLGYLFSLLPVLSHESRGLLLTFNAGGTLMIFFFAFAFLARGKEVMATGLGAAALALAALIYLSRAGEEYLWLHGNPTIFWICIAAGLLHAFLFFWVRIPRVEAAGT